MTPAAPTGYVAVPLFGALIARRRRSPSRPCSSGSGFPRPQWRGGHPAGTAHLLLEICGGGCLLCRRGDHLPGIRVAVAAQDNPAAGGNRDVGCIWLARTKIIAAKTAEGWYAGLRQTAVADTSWRTQPQPSPPAGSSRLSA